MEFKFDEKTHRYTLDGKPLTGVTTVLGVIAKPALIGWSANMACEYVRDNLKDLKDLEAVLAEAKVAHRKKKEKAGDIGTLVHAHIENWIKISMGQEPTNKDLAELDMTGKKMFENFTNWALENKVEFLESEKKMYSKELWVGGTCDFVCVINGEKLVGDIKTASGIYAENYYQTAAYRMLLEEMGQGGFVGSVIVNIKKDGTFNQNEDVVVSYGYEDEKEAFLGALKLYRVGESYQKKFNNKI